MTPAAQDHQIDRMVSSADSFYQSAKSIEFYPLMQLSALVLAYVRCCKDAHQRGIDIVQNPDFVPDDELRYMKEKLSLALGSSRIFSNRDWPGRNRTTAF